MDRLFDIGFLILSQMAVGGTVLMGLLPLKIVGKALFRINGLLFLISMMMALALFSFREKLFSYSGEGIVYFFSLFLLFLFIHLITLWLGGRKIGQWALWMAGGVGMSGLIWTGLSYSHQMSQSFLNYLLPLNFCISALLMGSGLVGMNLGHCYLTNIHLPISPYKRISNLFLIFLVFQACITTIGLFQMNDGLLLKKAIYLENIEGLFLWIRILIGFLGPFILILMIIHTVRLRSTQSATGLMYIAMMMVIAGEFFSRFFLLSNQRLL